MSGLQGFAEVGKEITRRFSKVSLQATWSLYTVHLPPGWVWREQYKKGLADAMLGAKLWPTLYGLIP